jgi:hypothetical protein
MSDKPRRSDETRRNGKAQRNEEVRPNCNLAPFCRRAKSFFMKPSLKDMFREPLKGYATQNLNLIKHLKINAPIF